MLTKCGRAENQERRSLLVVRTDEFVRLNQQKNGWTGRPAEARPVSIRCRRVHSPLLREWGPKRAGRSRRQCLEATGTDVKLAALFLGSFPVTDGEAGTALHGVDGLLRRHSCAPSRRMAHRCRPQIAEQLQMRHADNGARRPVFWQTPNLSRLSREVNRRCSSHSRHSALRNHDV